MKARDLFDAGETWTDRTTRLALPILLRRAADGDAITYGELRDAVRALHRKAGMSLSYRYVAGKIGDICSALRKDLHTDVPPLNAIIVNGYTHLPSHGVDFYLAQYFGMTKQQIGRLTDEERDAYARAAMEKVFHYNGWDRVRQHLGVRRADLDDGWIERGKPIPYPDPKGFATGPETVAHRELKAWVAAHPKEFSQYGNFGRGRTEYLLASGDRFDVYFENAQRRLAAEIKTRDAPDAEIERGIYQCGKYRAILRAMQLAASQPPNARAVLVLDRRPPPTAIGLAERLSVDIISVCTRSRHAPHGARGPARQSIPGEPRSNPRPGRRRG